MASPFPLYVKKVKPTPPVGLVSWEISPVTLQPRCPNCSHPVRTSGGPAVCDDCGAYLVAPMSGLEAAPSQHAASKEEEG